MPGVQDRVIVVTGAGGGLGREYALTLAREGASVVVNDLGGSRDGSGAGSAMADQVVKAFGGVDILVNNAGANVFYEPLAMPDDEWERCLKLDLEAAWICARAVLPGMLAKGAGNIVNIASCHAFRIIPHTFPYPVAKHALVGLTRSLGIEYAARGIRVNAIAPGYIETPIAEAYWATFADPAAERQRAYDLHPPKRIGQPEEVAMTAVFLASDEARFINAETITIDGGRSVLYHD